MVGATKAGLIWKLYNLFKKDGVHQYAVRRPLTKKVRKPGPKIPRFRDLLPHMSHGSCHTNADALLKARRRLQKLLSLGPREQTKPRESARNRWPRDVGCSCCECPLLSPAKREPLRMTSNDQTGGGGVGKGRSGQKNRKKQNWINSGRQNPVLKQDYGE